MSSASGSTLTYAAEAVCSLANGPKAIKRYLIKDGAVESLAKLITSLAGQFASLAVSALVGLAHGGRKHCSAIACTDVLQVLPTLLQHVKLGLRHRTVLLCQLLASSSSRARAALVQANIVPKLAELAQHDDLANLFAAMSVLRAMAWGDQTCYWLLMTQEEVGELVGRMRAGDVRDAGRAALVAMLMAACSGEQAEALVATGALPALMYLMASRHALAARMAEEAVLMIARGPAACRLARVRVGVLDCLADQLDRFTSPESVTVACKLLRSLACRSMPQDDTLQDRILPGVVHALGLSSADVRSSALDALRALCAVSFDGCRVVARASVMPALRHPMLLPGATEDHRRQSLQVMLRVLRQSDDARAELAGSSETLKAVVDAGSSSDDKNVQELACLSLAGCLMGPDECKKAVCEAGGLKSMIKYLRTSRGSVASELQDALQATAEASEEFRESVVAAGFR